MRDKGPLRILVVEDEYLMRWSLAEALRAAGHTVRQAADAAEAIRALRESPAVDVILLDCRLPDSDDLTLLCTIRCLAPRTPVVMMTAFGTPELFGRARELGVADILTKPFDVFAVESVLRNAARVVAH
jgi:DNA-binding NtrC family response regulator